MGPNSKGGGAASILPERPHADDIGQSVRSSVPQQTKELRSWRQVQEFSQLVDKAQLFKRADEITDQTRVEPQLLDFLYDRRQSKALPREIWEKQVRGAWALEMLMRRSAPALPMGSNFGLIEESAKLEVLNKLQESPGTLLLNFHGGFITARRKFYAHYVQGEKRGIILTRRSAKEDAGQALFAGLRALQQGQSVLMAPDGPEGRQTEMFEVAGRSMPGGEGAAYLAGASKCPTAWFILLRRGDRFVPVLQPGPQRQKGEPFEEFKTRLYRFCSRRFEALVTGDPHNLVLRPRWVSLFCEETGKRGAGAEEQYEGDKEKISVAS